MTPIFSPPPEDRPFLRRLAWLIVIVALLGMVWRALDLVLLAFGSVLGAVVFRSTARLIRRAGVRHAGIALGLAMLLVLSLIGLIGYLLAVQFGGEIGAMLSDLPSTIAQIERALGRNAVGRTLIEATRVATSGGNLANRLATLTQGAGEVLLNFVIVMVGAVFIALNPAAYVSGAIMLTPPAARPAMRHAIGEVSRALRLWLMSKIIAMAVMAVLIGGGLWLAGLRSWAALGLLGGLSEFVPYVGPAVAMLPAIGLAAAEGDDLLWRTILAYGAVRLFEAYALTPGLTRNIINIPPAMTLFVILGAGAVFGVYGLFFAGALLVVGFVAVRELYLRDTLGEDISGLPRAVEERRRRTRGEPRDKRDEDIQAE